MITTVFCTDGIITKLAEAALETTDNSLTVKTKDVLIDIPLESVYAALKEADEKRRQK